ncbi:MAG: ABC transporter permease [Gaiellaceae bacterium]
MTPPKQSDLLSSGAGLASAVAVEVHGELGELEVVKARGYWEQVWLRFKRDKVAILGGIFIAVLILIAFAGAPLAEARLGHGPNDVNTSGGLDPSSQLPVGPWTTVTTEPYPGAPGNWEDTLYILGADSQLGRDMFLRLLYGAQTSLQVAILATLLSVSIGLLMGLIAGYYRGWVDTVVSRLTEIVMAFPYLLFVIAVAATVGDRLNKITFGGLLHPGVFTLVLIFGVFGWFYPARIIRSQILSLREKEFVEAARMTGAGDWRIMRSHLLPHLVAPLIVYSTLIVANNVIAEAGLSFLGLGIPAPTASWGNLLAEGPNYYLTQPWLMVWPGLAILLTTLAFNLLGDGLRDAFDPRAAH